MQSRRDLAARTLVALEAFRGALWQFRSDCLPRAIAAQHRLARAAIRQLDKETAVASLETCSGQYQRMTDAYIAWTWQVNFLTESILELPPCEGGATNRAKGAPLTACRLFNCPVPFQAMVREYDTLTSEYARYVSGQACPRELVHSAGRFSLLTRLNGCAISLTTMRVNEAAQYRDPIGYCDQLFRELEDDALHDNADDSLCRAAASAKWIERVEKDALDTWLDGELTQVCDVNSSVGSNVTISTWPATNRH